MLNYLLRKIKGIDFLGNDFQPKFSDNTRHSSVTGGCISCFVLLLTFSIISIYIYEYFDYSSPDILVSTTKSTNFPKYDLYQKGFFPLIHIRKNNQPLHISEIPRHLTILGELRTVTQNSDITKTEYIQVPVKPCMLLENPDTMKNDTQDERVKPFIDNYSYCVDITEDLEKEYYLINAVLDVPYRSLAFYLYPCSLDSGCVTDPGEIYLISLVIGLNEYTFDPSNLTQPISIVPNSFLTYFLSSKTQIYGVTFF